MATSPLQPDRIYAASALWEFGQGLFRSDDRGETWRHVLANGLIRDIEVSLTDADKLWIAGYFGLGYSDDGGETWRTLFNQVYPVVSVSVDHHNPDLILIGVAGMTDGVCRLDYCAYRSIDGGSTWEPVFPGNVPLVRSGYPLYVMFDQFDPRRAFANDYHSEDRGWTWQPGREMPWRITVEPQFGDRAFGFTAQYGGQLVRRAADGALWQPVEQPRAASNPRAPSAGPTRQRVYAYECVLGKCRFWWKLDEPTDVPAPIPGTPTAFLPLIQVP